jgi:hypothetical protein
MLTPPWLAWSHCRHVQQLWLHSNEVASTRNGLFADLLPFWMCRYMDLEAFVEEATVARAVVWLSLQGGGASGQLQQWLEDYHVPFVGKLPEACAASSAPSLTVSLVIRVVCI